MLSTYVNFSDFSVSVGPQTGDTNYIILIALFAVFMLLSIFMFVNKRKSFQSKININNGQGIFSNKKILIGFLGICICVLTLFACLGLNGLVIANADQANVSAKDNITASYNPDDKTIVVEDDILTKKSSEIAKVTSIELKYVYNNEDLSNANWKIDTYSQNIFSGSAPQVKECNFFILDQLHLKISVDGLSEEQLINLRNQKVLQIIFNYETQSAPEGFECDIMPQSTQLLDATINLANKFNIEACQDIDQSTKNHADKLLTTKTNSSEKLILGTVNTDNNAKNMLISSGFYNPEVYTKYDGYQVLVLPNSSVIVGKDSDAVFMGVTTLSGIINSINDKTCARSFLSNDFAITKYRGFIEGYYGIPWSPENRLDLQDYGGQFKMNTYIFAPKDDEYHSSKWYEPYPDQKLTEIKKYVDKGEETKVRFSWAIHPFMGKDQFNWDNYEYDKQRIINKYEQLYNIGVRKFGLSADDMDKTAIIEDQVRLLKDLESWAKSKGDITSLIFVPKIYNEGFIYTDFDEKYLRGMRELDDFFDIMWTGCAVMGPCATDTFNRFKAYTGHDAFMWMNFPVNDYCDKCLLMGKGQIMQDNVTNFKGLVSNPMQQAQASKVALYETAYYTWRSYKNDDERTKVWKDSFKYVDAGAPDNLYEICKHLSYWNSEWLELEESEEISIPIDTLKQKLIDKKDTDVTDVSQIKSILTNISTNIEAYKTKCSNYALCNEIQPWLDSFKQQITADLFELDALVAVNNGNLEEAKRIMNDYNVNGIFDASQKHIIPSLASEENYAEPGNKRLFPFAKALNTRINELIGS